MKLLALEDETEGLLDAAFMQFYLTAEALLGSEKSSEAAKSFAKRFQTANAVAVQRCIYQVYGFGDVTSGTPRPRPLKQRRSHSTSPSRCSSLAGWRDISSTYPPADRSSVVREMRLHRELTSVEFRGTERELRSGFVLPGIADPFSARVFDELGNELP
jgi:hypothetical protein